MGNAHPLSDKQDFILWLKGQPETIDMTPTGALNGTYSCRCVLAQYLRARTGEVWTVGPFRFGPATHRPESRYTTPPWAARLIQKVDMAQDGYQIERDHVLYLAERELPS